MRKRALVGGVCFIGAVAVALWLLGLLPWSAPPAEQPSPGQPDPRLTYKGPFQNVDPNVAYVGSELCADCHGDVVNQYSKHPMGRSLTPIAETINSDIYDAKHHNPFKAYNSLFYIDRKQKTMFHRQSRLDAGGKEIYKYAFQVDYEIGSGAIGKSYLANRDGVLYMTPITYYAQKKIWDVSPGFHELVLQLGRPVRPDCLFCHTSRANHWQGSINRYKEPIFRGHAIGCERCHGPGSRHREHRLESMNAPKTLVTDTKYTMTDPSKSRKADFTIVNPRHLPPRLRDAICEQCHLVGEAVVRRGRKLYDFRPGLPLESCLAVFVDASRSGQKRENANHVEQMHLSRCWQETSGWHKMGCISCHNPHVKPGPKERVTWFRKKCLDCHGPTDNFVKGRHGPGCAMPKAQRLKKNRRDDCTACHMRRFQPKDISHSAVTDHRILRRPNSMPARFPHRDDSGWPITHFHKGAFPQGDISRGRDLAVALYLYSTHTNLDKKHLDNALALLQKTLENDPEDWLAWEMKGSLQMKLQDYAAALKSFRTLLKGIPNHEMSLRNVADILQGQKKADEAIVFWKRVIKINKWHWRDHANLAVLLAGREEWNDVDEHLRIARKLAPERIEVRLMWIRRLLQKSRHSEAKAELRIVQRLAPQRAGEFQNWFKSQQR